MSGKRYPEEFKIGAVKQVVGRGHSVSSIATHLDITTYRLYARIKKLDPDSSTNKEQSDVIDRIRKQVLSTARKYLDYPWRFISEKLVNMK